jgi:sporulation protein YlmC with PRC-barrel domain
MLQFRQERIAAQKEGDMLISNIMRKEVLDKNANKIGMVVDIDYNFPLWTINYLVVRMGIMKKINVGVEKINKIGDKVILKVAKDELVKVIV